MCASYICKYYQAGKPAGRLQDKNRNQCAFEKLETRFGKNIFVRDKYEMLLCVQK